MNAVNCFLYSVERGEERGLKSRWGSNQRNDTGGDEWTAWRNIRGNQFRVFVSPVSESAPDLRFCFKQDALLSRLCLRLCGHDSGRSSSYHNRVVVGSHSSEFEVIGARLGNLAGALQVEDRLGATTRARVGIARIYQIYSQLGDRGRAHRERRGAAGVVYVGMTRGRKVSFTVAASSEVLPASSCRQIASV